MSGEGFRALVKALQSTSSALTDLSLATDHPDISSDHIKMLTKWAVVHIFPFFPSLSFIL